LRLLNETLFSLLREIKAQKKLKAICDLDEHFGEQAASSYMPQETKLDLITAKREGIGCLTN